MRTGLAGPIQPFRGEEECLETFVALMRLFVKDSVTVAANYASGKGCASVDAPTMRRALMYSARTFFQQEEKAMNSRVEEEYRSMMEEDDEEEGEEEEGEEGEEEGEEEGKEEDDATCDPDPAFAQLVRHVDAIEQTWHLWNPTDPVHQRIKQSIDATALTPDEPPTPP